MRYGSVARKGMIWLFWLALWELVNRMIGNEVIFVGPFGMAKALMELLPEKFFWITLSGSFLKISAGFLAAFAGGILLGSLAYCFPWIGELAEPLLLTIRSVPVASFVILALIWVGAPHLSVLIAGLVVFPMIYAGTRTGLENTDPRLLEMAQVFSVSFWKRLRYIYIPAVHPYLLSSCRTALGMSWKSGVAAEVIGIPERSIGEQLYYSKLYLDTAGLFAWTCAIIVISAVFERLFLAVLNRVRH